VVAPSLSVVVALQDTREAAVACVSSLLSQRDLPPSALEIILVDGSRDGTGELVSKNFPDLPMLRPDPPFSLPRLLGAGIRSAHGDLVGITEGCVTFAPEWAGAMAGAHGASRAAAIGGAVDPGADLGSLDLALYLSDYSQFASPLQGGPVHDLPGNNVVFKREALLPAVSSAEAGFWKTFFCRRLEAEGKQFLAEPRAKAVYHRRSSLARFARRRWVHGRCWGAIRAKSSSTALRAFIAAGEPVVPLLLGIRLVARVCSKRSLWRPLLRGLPFVPLALLLWWGGECCGHFLGAGKTCEEL